MRFIASPAIGGLIIGHEVARAMGTRFIFTERDPDTKKMLLRRGFSVMPGETGVVVEDVITTGGSTQDVIETLQAPARRCSRQVDHRPIGRVTQTWACPAWRWRRCRWRRITPNSVRCARSASRL